MKNLYIILAEAHMGKSSLMRCLTGIYRSKKTWVKTNQGNMEIYVFTSSLQEKKCGIQEAINNINNTPVDDVFVAIRIDSTGGCPIGQDYYNAFTNLYNIKEVVILGTNQMNIPNNLITRIPNPRLNPPNDDARVVRNSWGWV